MKRLIPYIAFACLTGITSANFLPVIAGGCNNHMNKTAKIKCAEDEADCQTEKSEKFDFKETVES